MSTLGQFFITLLTITVIVFTTIVGLHAEEKIPDPSKAKNVISYKNALMVGPPKEGSETPTIVMTDRVIVRDDYAYVYNVEGKETVYKLGAWAVYTSALSLNLPKEYCKHAQVYVIPKGHDISLYPLTKNQAMCVDYDPKKEQWILSKDFYDIKTNEILTILEHMDPELIDVYLIEPNGMLSIVNNEVKMTLQ